MLDFTDPRTFERAAEGCTALFLLRPPAIARVETTLNRFVDVARSCGTGHVVFLSVAGAGSNKLVPHHAVEAHLARRPGDWTTLRPGFFAQNLADAYLRDIVEEDRLYVPAGEGLVTFVDVSDVADVAALAFQDPAAHRGRVHTLTGPEALSFREVARTLTDALGRPIRYQRASVPGYALHLHERGLSLGQCAVQTILHVGLRFGQAATIDPTLSALLGRPATTLHEYVSKHARLWQRATRAPSCD